jgi:hypothetical protein
MKTQTYKIIFAAFLIATIPLMAKAAIGDNLGYERRKNATLTALDNSISRIENAKNTVSNNPKLDNEVKQNIIQNLTAMQDTLTNYKAEVESTTTLAELRALNQEIIQYIIDNKDVIRNNIRMALVNLGQQVFEKTNEFIDDVENLLRIMKVTCSEQSDKITEVESQLADLQNSLNLLQQAIQTKNTSTIKSEVRKISDLSKSIVENLKIIEQAC